MMKVLDKIEEWLIAIVTFVMIVLCFGNVLSRHLLKFSWSFTEELLIIMFIWCVMLATATGFKRLEHLGLPLIYDAMPVPVKKIFVVFSYTLTALLVILLGYSGYSMVKNQIEFNQTTSVLGLPEWVAGLSIPVGGLFILVRAIQMMVRQLAELKEETQP